MTEKNLNSSIQEGVEIDIKYEGYLKRQKNNIDQINRQSCKALPQEINYEKIDTLSFEASPKFFGFILFKFSLASKDNVSIFS